jgi:hypothetical protein
VFGLFDVLQEQSAITAPVFGARRRGLPGFATSFEFGFVDE